MKLGRPGSNDATLVFFHQMKLGRNEPCWCRSGKKYKKCHLGRSEQKRVSRQEALDASRRARRERTCFHPKASAASCGRVIAAHSVQRSGGGLASVARDGHVYGYRSDFSTRGRILPKLFGVSDASTFTGFCDRHDAELFRPLERAKFEGTGEQLALLGFRAICRDLMAKKSTLILNPFLKEIGDRGLPLAQQVEWQRQRLEYEGGTSLAMKDLEYAKDRLEAAIVSGNYSNIHGAVYHFDRTPALLASSPFTPEFDFDGRLLQDLNDAERIADVLTFSMIGDGAGAGAAAFVWVDDAPAVVRFISSAQQIPKSQVPHRLVQFALECFENVFWSPEWWDALDERTRTTLLQRMNAQTDGTRPRNHLANDGTQSATWAVSRITIV